MRRALSTAAALLLAGVLSAPAAQAQSAEQDAVYAVVTGLFDGMRTRDTASMRAAFVSGATLQSVSANGIRVDAIDAWIGSVGSAPAGLVLDERLANPVVQVDGDLASVWVEYWFFAGERFSHCGVDAFVLARQGGAWRIISVADTRKREGCAPAPAR
ncbi:MAG: nuclear transport factor 2 family protein [Gemmatimonadaceae bacterium]|nr:nuclear transport factor 2 family protein [Gemmatimonadaceae bacterium]MCW5827041.1 nuclear transport factor 2 family protein [Gemmatimonadaceae bacterium]